MLSGQRAGASGGPALLGGTSHSGHDTEPSPREAAWKDTLRTSGQDSRSPSRRNHKPADSRGEEARSDPEGLRAGRLHQSSPETQAPCTQREGHSALLLRPSPRLQGGAWLVRDPFHWEKESGFRVSETKEFLSSENEQMPPS